MEVTVAQGGVMQKVDRHQDGLAVRDPVGCVNCPKQQNDDQRNTQQTQEHRQIVARGAENLLRGTSAMAMPASSIPMGPIILPTLLSVLVIGAAARRAAGTAEHRLQ